jgi:hypothetical protein
MASCWSFIPLKKDALPEAGDAGLASDSKLMRLCQPTPLVATAAFHPLWRLPNRTSTNRAYFPRCPSMKIGSGRKLGLAS